MSDLTQDEVDKMLSDQPEASSEETLSGAVVDYDFRHPNKIPEEQKRTVMLIHETFAQTLNLSLSAFLRTEMSVQFEKLEQCSFYDYIKTLDNPTCLINFSMTPLNGYGLLEINAPIVYTIIDRMLGGTGEIPKIGRSFTDLELSIVHKFAGILLSCHLLRY